MKLSGIKLGLLSVTHSVLMLLACSSPEWCLSQQSQAGKSSPGVVKTFTQQSSSLTGMVADSKQNAGKKFNYWECRADVQKWTSDGSADDSRPSFGDAVVIEVNGQLRLMPMATLNVSYGGLGDRVYELAVCKDADSEFEGKYKTYSRMREIYEEEEHSRMLLFLIKHSLLNQFLSEDSSVSQ